MIDGKFGRITVEKHGEHHTEPDEPVFILCASDLAAADAIGEYLNAATRRGAGEKHLQGTRSALNRFYAWRQDHADLMHVAGQVPAGEQD